MKSVLTVTLACLALGGCALLAEGREDELPSAREMGAGECQPAGPHDAAAPGEWVCDRGDAREEVQPRHRVEDN